MSSSPSILSIILHMPYWCATIVVSVFAFIEFYLFVSNNLWSTDTLLTIWVCIRLALGIPQFFAHALALMPARFSSKVTTSLAAKRKILHRELFYKVTLVKCNYALSFFATLGLIVLIIEETQKTYSASWTDVRIYEIATEGIWFFVLLLRLIGKVSGKTRDMFFLAWDEEVEAQFDSNRESTLISNNADNTGDYQSLAAED